MFNISNEIAYNNRMIHGEHENQNVPIKPHPGAGHNRWEESLGTCTTKQYKNELAKDILPILIEAAQHNRTIKDIYIITPFKAVATNLKNDLAKNSSELMKVLGWDNKNFKYFCKNNIGTVHTFQGKESDTVILVLGCDRKNQGGAVWASSKPNLLNVAVTRAKNHLFIVGDSQVWSDKPYFNRAYQALSNKI